MSVAAELNRDRFGRDITARIGDVRPRYVVIDSTVQIIGAMVMVIVMGSDIVPIGVMIVVSVIVVIIVTNMNAEAMTMIVMMVITKVNTNSVAVSLMMVVMMLRADKRRWPERYQGDNGHDTELFHHLNGSPRICARSVTLKHPP